MKRPLGPSSTRLDAKKETVWGLGPSDTTRLRTIQYGGQIGRFVVLIFLYRGELAFSLLIIVLLIFFLGVVCIV